MEYALLLAGIAAVMVAIVYALGQATEGLFKRSCEEIVAVQEAPADRCAPAAP